MKPIAAAAFAFALLCGAARPAAAAIHICTGSIAEVGVNHGGLMTMRYVDNGDHFYLCSTVSTWADITPENCKSWMSQLLASWSMGRPISLFFDTDNPSNADMTGCGPANFAWTSRPPYFVLNRPS